VGAPAEAAWSCRHVCPQSVAVRISILFRFCVSIRHWGDSSVGWLFAGLGLSPRDQVIRSTLQALRRVASRLVVRSVAPFVIDFDFQNHLFFPSSRQHLQCRPVAAPRSAQRPRVPGELPWCIGRSCSRWRCPELPPIVLFWIFHSPRFFPSIFFPVLLSSPPSILAPPLFLLPATRWCIGSMTSIRRRGLLADVSTPRRSILLANALACWRRPTAKYRTPLSSEI